LGFGAESPVDVASILFWQCRSANPTIAIERPCTIYKQRPQAFKFASASCPGTGCREPVWAPSKYSALSNVDLTGDGPSQTYKECLISFAPVNSIRFQRICTLVSFSPT
jgi:hypothetical protein